MARPRKNFNKTEKPSVDTQRGTEHSEPFVKDETIPITSEDVVGNTGVDDTGLNDVDVAGSVIEPESIVPDSEVTEEMKQEEPINTPEKAVPVVEHGKTFDERIGKCSLFFNKEYFDRVAKSGCDYKAFGDWQKGYCGLLDRVFGVRGKEVLDVGSAYGAIGNGFKQLGAKKVTCVDISKTVIDAKTFDGVEYVLAPIQKMKEVANASKDLIHASYIMNSVDVDQLEMAFVEMKRVLAPKGKIFIIMNFGRDNKIGDFDTRHSKETILKAAMSVGLKEVTDIVNQLRKVDDARYEFISNYNWGIVCFE